MLCSCITCLLLTSLAGPDPVVSVQCSHTAKLAQNHMQMILGN